MDGLGMLWAWFLGVFIIFLLPLITLAAVAFAVRYREKTGRWKGRPLVILSVWALFVVGDVPIKLVLLGLSCTFFGGVRVADDFDRTKGVEGWSLSSGCNAECIRQLDSAAGTYQAFYVYSPNTEHHAEAKGFFEYWRAPTGDPHCVAEWWVARAAAQIKPASAYPNGECLARAVIENAPVGRPIYVYGSNSPWVPGVIWGWTHSYEQVGDAVSGTTKASIRNFHARFIWWLPWLNWQASCTNVPSNLTIFNVHRGDG